MVQPTSLLLLRLILTFTTFLFVVQQFSLFSFFHWFESNLFFYLFLPLIATALITVTWRHHPNVPTFFRSLLISFFSPVFLFALAYSSSKEFHYLVPFSVGLYTISFFAFLACQYATKKRDRTSPVNEKILSPLSWKKPDTRFALLFVVIFTLMFFVFGLQNLTRFAAVDEPLWLDGRIGKYWKSISEQWMDKTLVSDKPGITIAIASGPGLFFVEAKDYRNTRNDFEAKHPGTSIEDLYLAFRLPLLIAITLLLPLFYLLLVSLVGTSAALFGYSAITLSPVLIGMSKIVNPDSLLWVFAPLSFLAYLVFLEKRAWRYLLLSGVLFGFALLTKYVANFLVVYIFALSFLYPLWKQDEKLTLSFLFKVFLIWFGISVATLYLFVPAFWVHPMMLLESTLFSQAFEKVAWIFIVLMTLVFLDQFLVKSRVSLFFIETLKPYGGIFGKIILGFFILTFSIAFLNGIFGMPWIHFSEMLASPKTSGLQNLPSLFFTNFYPLTFGVAPLILLGMSIMLWQAWTTPFRSFTSLHRLALALILFILLYYLGSTVNGVVLINRYQIMLYPLMALLGGIGLFILVEILWRSFHKSSLTTFPALILLVGISLLLAFSPFISRFPLSYTSYLLPKQYSVDVKDMGAGSYEAAMYLNELPNAKETAIWTDKTGVCKFYVGPCLDGFNLSKLKANDVRYVVLSSGRAARTAHRFAPAESLSITEDVFRLDTYYQRTDPLYEIRINGRANQYVKIFPVNH